VHIYLQLFVCWETRMFLDLLFTVLASAVIGWNVGSWLVPSSWLAVVFLAAVIKNTRGPALFGGLH